MLEPLHPDGIGGDMRMERLEYDLLGGFVVAGLIDDSSRVPPELGLDGVMSDGSPNQRIGFGTRLGVLDHPNASRAWRSNRARRACVRRDGHRRWRASLCRNRRDH